MTQRAHYWTSSKFADWVRRAFGAAPKLNCGTAEEWGSWRRTAKTNHPCVYWVTETFLDDLQDFVNWPFDRYDDIRTYCYNRFICKLHYAPTQLKPGQWHETDTRMLHANFELLVDFIEVEKAHMQLWCSPELPRPWWRKFRFTRWGEFRSVKLGLEHLEWEIKLRYDEDWMEKDNPKFGLPTPQAESAAEQLLLYHWWKNVRPNRPDPMDASGYTEYFAQKRARGKGDGLDEFESMFGESTSEEEEETQAKCSTLCHELEAQYDNEDTEMLIRLIKVRHHLWT